MIHFSSARTTVHACRALVFDLDDTLFPEREYVLSGFRHVARWAAAELGIPAVDGELALRTLFDQGARGDTFNRWLASHGLASAEAVAKLISVYRAHTPQISPFPGMPKLLRML